jgi:hypothetical protein
MALETNNVVVISDIHAGCKLALCPPEGVDLDDGGKYMPSAFQKKMWSMWEEFWLEWVPFATKDEPYCVIFNGDAIEGVHHGATTPITTNRMTQGRIAKRVLERVVELCEGRFYFVRGTEAHVGPSAEAEEGLAKSLKAIPNAEGQYARYDLWKTVGPGKLIHALHHIGSTGSQAYEATAVHKELVEEFAEAGRWRNQPPDVVVRSHRHRYMKTSVPIGHTGPKGKQATGEAISVVTPCWQGKTPFVWKIPGGRLSTPQFGGIVVRWAHDELFVRPKVWTVDRSKTE